MTARALLAGNPDLVLHHMHDPNQDRLTLRRVACFRVKRTRLGPAYERFLRYQVAATRWQAPVPDGDSPEAQWGFQPALRDDVIAFARRRGYQVRRLIFDDPQDLSPARRRPVPLVVPPAPAAGGPAADRVVHSPRTLVGTAQRLCPVRDHVPAPALDRRARPLPASVGPVRLPAPDAVLPRRAIGGTGPIEQWRSVLDHARVAGSFAGVAPQRYPSDLATFFAYQRALRAIPARCPIPEPLPLDMFDRFLAQHHHRYPTISAESVG